MMKSGCLPFILAVVLAFTCICTASCGGSATYKTDVAVSEISAAVDALLDNPGDFATMTEGYIVGMMEIDPSQFEECVIKLRASGSNIDEYGIFKAADSEGVANAVAVANAYIARRIEAWMPEYMPEELPKMEAASVKIFGNYVVYAILAEDVKADVFDAVKAELTDK